MNNTNIALVPILDKTLDFELIVSPTPTKTIIIKPIKDLEIIPFVTNKPTATPTDRVIVVTATPTTDEPTPTVKEEITVAPSPSPQVTTAPKNEIGNNQVIWFLTAIIGILVIIVLAQSWPKKEDETPDES